MQPNTKERERETEREIETERDRETEDLNSHFTKEDTQMAIST